ncbi:MAG: T9SS type A sorting domain-containing protein, partial [Flavobacteriales bacterium]|nr:T9SS type A sorting domain-containing protein [Flavobacteriales bacterium]
DVLLNMRVRGRVNGTYAEFGPACRFRLLSAPPACPLTQLIDDPNNVHFSCGVTRSFGGSDKVVAYPLSGATHYRFRFENTGEGYLRFIAGTSVARILNWVTNPLVPGVTYDVTVAASFDGGATYCPFGPVCEVTISGPPPPAAPTCTDGIMNGDEEDVDCGGSCPLSCEAAAFRNGAVDVARIDLYPNPNRGDQLFINLTNVGSEVNTASVDIYDLTGKRVSARTIAVQDGILNTTLHLNGDLAGGVYLVNITAGTKTRTERLVIQP